MGINVDVVAERTKAMLAQLPDSMKGQPSSESMNACINALVHVSLRDIAWRLAANNRIDELNIEEAHARIGSGIGKALGEVVLEFFPKTRIVEVDVDIDEEEGKEKEG